ncbi:MAG: hypothetical protein EBS06_02780 [Proteobacteria bacterium]|nr:hypothetical protein [Pseudomonadota bacterium]
MGIFRKALYSHYFAHDRFDKKYPFDLTNQLRGYLKTFGEENPDKTFYVIWRSFLGAGFFSNFTQVISHMQAAKRLGMIPVIDFKNFKTLYNEKTPINGKENSWEYYFKQVSPYDLEEVYRSKRVFFCNGEPAPQSVFEVEKIEEKSYKDFVKNNIHLQENVEKELEKYSHFFDKRILGVHFRGKELNVAQLHGYGPTPEQMLRYTDEILEKYKIERIFISTEEKDYFDLFIKRYGDKVFYSDALRTSKVNSYNLINYRTNHRYLLGMEALVDSILLSKCNGLLRGNSCMSSHAERVGDHEFCYFVNNGINFGKWYLAKYSYRIKKLLPKNFGGLLDEVIIKTKPQ